MTVVTRNRRHLEEIFITNEEKAREENKMTSTQMRNSCEEAKSFKYLSVNK